MIWLQVQDKLHAADQFHCHNQHSHDDGNLVIAEGFHNKSCPSEGDSNTAYCLEPTCSSVHAPLPQTEDELKEIWAATVIQTAFRAFLVCVHIVGINLLIHSLQVYS
jgi:hypothetical protein